MSSDNTHKAEICIWIELKFKDNGKDSLKDQAYEETLTWLDVPAGRLAGLEVLQVEPLA